MRIENKGEGGTVGHGSREFFTTVVKYSEIVKNHNPTLIPLCDD